MSDEAEVFNVFLFVFGFEPFSLPRKQFCSCVRPVTLIYCVKMVTYFSFVCSETQILNACFIYCITFKRELPIKCIIQKLIFFL